jgi:hypothetical protein
VPHSQSIHKKRQAPSHASDGACKPASRFQAIPRRFREARAHPEDLAMQHAENRRQIRSIQPRPISPLRCNMRFQKTSLPIKQLIKDHAPYVAFGSSQNPVPDKNGCTFMASLNFKL